MRNFRESKGAEIDIGKLIRDKNKTKLFVRFLKQNKAYTQFFRNFRNPKNNYCGSLKEYLIKNDIIGDFIKKYGENEVWLDVKNNNNLFRLYSIIISNAFPWSDTEERPFFWETISCNFQNKVMPQNKITYQGLNSFMNLK